MKLIFVNRYFFPDHSATAQLLSGLAFTLAGRGWVVHVVTGRERYNASGSSFPAEEVIRGVRVHRVWTSRFGRTWLTGRMIDYLTFYSSAAWRLWRVTRSGDIVVAETDPPLFSVVAAVTTRMRSAKLVNWLQDLFPEVAQVLEVRGVNGAVGRILRNLRDISLRGASKNVVLGQRMRERVERAGVTAASVCIISNWECGRTITPVAKDHNWLRREWRLEDKFVVGYSGNMGRAHEFDTIVQAASLLRQHDNIVFLWIGDGARRQWLQQQANSLRLSNFIFKSYQPRSRLFESLSLPDVHLISLWPALEGLIVPSKLYGVIAAGRPTLFVGDIEGEVAVVLRQHRCGYAVSPGDGQTLARHIVQLASNHELLQLMGDRARHAFEATFEKRFALDRWEGILQHIARQRQRTPQYDSGGFRIDTRHHPRCRALGEA